MGRFSGFISIAAKSSTQKFFLVAAIYEHLVGGLVKTLYTCIVSNFYRTSTLLTDFNKVPILFALVQMLSKS